MNEIVFNLSITELVAFLGLFQTIFILVYIAFRSNHLLTAITPFLFFLVLGSGFFIVLAQGYWKLPTLLHLKINWVIWALCAPISSLFVMQVARITKPPRALYYLIILIIPLAFSLSYLLHSTYNLALSDVFPISAIIVGSLSLSFIWLNRSYLDKLHKRQHGKERFWLIMALIALNIALMILNLFDEEYINLARVLIGLGFLYVTSTILFRIYPPVLANLKVNNDKQSLNSKEIDIALEIENLLHVQKVYQEKSYNRASMAKELDLPETHLSKIVNLYFNKSVPLLLNELRVQEAKILLNQTDAEISVIAEESGFNSIATFNRVFKDLTKFSPKEYRKQ